MSIDRLGARQAARAAAAGHDEHNFGSIVRQAAPGAGRRAEIEGRARALAEETRSLNAQSQALARQQAELARTQQEEAQALLRQQQAQAALEREQRPTMPPPVRLP